VSFTGTWARPTRVEVKGLWWVVKPDSLKPWAIYKLTDPREPDVVRYIGKTHLADPRRRLRKHLTEAVSGRDKTYCGNWKRSLLDAGVEPCLTIIELGEGEGWADAEMYWITHYQNDARSRLTNLTKGGVGIVGYQHSPETREKIAGALLGHVVSVTTREKLRHANTGRIAPRDQVERSSAARRGKKRSASAIEKTAAAKRGTKHTPEAIEKMRASKLGQKHTEEAKAKISAANKGKILSPESRAKIAAAAIGRILSDETKAKMNAAKRGRKQTTETIAKRVATRKINRESRKERKDEHYVA